MTRLTGTILQRQVSLFVSLCEQNMYQDYGVYDEFTFYTWRESYQYRYHRKNNRDSYALSQDMVRRLIANEFMN